MLDNGKRNIDRKYYLFAIKIIGNFGASIAVPVVAFSLLGQWLDTKYGTGARYTIIGFAVSAFISAKIIYRKAKQYGREYQDLSKK